MTPDVSQFSQTQGFVVIALVVLVPLILPFATAAAKRVLGPKSEDVATEAAAKAQQQASTLNVELSAALSASLAREAALRVELAKEQNRGTSGSPHPAP